MSLAHITQRIWRAHMEKFVDYVEENLMQILSLTEKEKIELLANDIRGSNIKEIRVECTIRNSA